MRQTGYWMADSKIKAHFIEPMLLVPSAKLPEGSHWVYELKLDGFRAEAIKDGGRIRFRSRNDKDFNARYPAIVQALAAMPNETVIDGEILALTTASLIYYVFDVMVLAGKDVMNEPLTVRRELLRDRVLTKLGEPIRESPGLEASLVVAGDRGGGCRGASAQPAVVTAGKSSSSSF